ncbi:MAG: hypothetical protein R3B06_13010 [Kofleriaceae bacterium]
MLDGQDEEADRGEPGADQEPAIDDAARLEDAADLDPLRGARIGVLEQEVVLHLAPQVEQDERPGAGDDEAEEAHRVADLAVEDRARHQHEERQQVQLLPVAGAAPGGGARDGEDDQEAAAVAQVVAGGDRHGQRVGQLRLPTPR